MRLNNRSILAVSVMITLAAHGLFLALAGRLPMLRANAAVATLEDRFHVRLLDDAPMAEEPVPAEASGPGLASRPGSVEDLLKTSLENIEPPSPAAPSMTELPGLPERAAAESIPREYDLAPDAEVLRRLDSKILEIDQALARENIDVARRLVRPSPDRILDEGDLPVLRAAGEGLAEPPLRFDRAARSLLAESMAGAAGSAQSAELPVYESPAPPDPPAEETRPEVKVEQILARAPIEQEAARVREERPYVFMDDLVDIKLDAYLPPDEKEGYFRLQVVPRKNGQVEVLPKDVTFVIDASSSIQQRKLDITVRGVQEAVKQLRPEDRFNVVVFRDTPTMFQQGLVQATEEAKAAARQFLSGAPSRGQTDVYKGILPVVQTGPREGAPGVVLLVSDGRPTAGLRDARMIINGLTADNNLRNSIFAFGGGKTVDRYLLDLLAYRNKGEAEVVKNIEDIDDDLPKFFQRLSDPLLVDLNADFGRINEAKVFPSVLPDFYRGQPVTVYGRFDPKKDREFFMRLSGRAADRKKELIFRTDLREAAGADREIARSWAFQKAYHLIGEISRQGETPELLGQLQELSQKYNIRTSYNP
jgi:Mg-chelatase subunit ChlD